MKGVRRFIARVPSPLKDAAAAALSLIAGLGVALLFDYLLYRIGLPSTPFIYVSF
jgi:hypothetical protein